MTIARVWPKRIQDQQDFAGAVGAGTDGYAVVWDNGGTSFALTRMQPYDADLAAIAGLTSAADKVPYFTGAGTAALADFTTYGRSLVDDADAGTARATLGLGTIATEAEAGYLLASGSRTGATSSAQIFTGGIATNGAATATYQATLNQSAHSNAIIMYGYDAQSAQYIAMGVNSGGTGFFQTTGNMLYTASGTLLSLKAGHASGVIRFQNNSNAEGLRMDQSLRVGIGGITSMSAFAHIAASTTATASLRIPTGVTPTAPNDGDIYNDGALTYHATDATTGAITSTLRLRRGSSGTPAAGFGSAIDFQLKSSTTIGQDAARITTSWLDATHASRGSRSRWSTYYTTTENVGVTIGSNSGGALLSFYDVATPIARQVLATGAGATVDNVITALQALGLVKQS